MEKLSPLMQETLDEAKDKVEDSEKEAIENGIQELEEALKGDDKEVIDEKLVLSEASAPLAQRMYEEEAKNNEAQSSDTDSNDQSDVVDADFEEVTEEKENQTN